MKQQPVHDAHASTTPDTRAAKTKEDAVASASDIIRTLVQDYLRKTKKKSER